MVDHPVERCRLTLDSTWVDRAWCMKLQFDEPLSSFAFEVNLRRYHPVDGPPAARAKFKSGLVSVRPGDTLVLELDASLSAAGEVVRPVTAVASEAAADAVDAEGSAAAAAEEGEVVVEVEVFFLSSYVHMGAARVTCGGGCGCAPQVLRGTNLEANTSVTRGHTFELRDAGDMARCRITLTNVVDAAAEGGAQAADGAAEGGGPVTGLAQASLSSGTAEHKFKLQSIHLGAKVKAPVIEPG